MNFNFYDKEIKSVCRDLEIPEYAYIKGLETNERRNVIDCWNNANIVACPGSGKTTVLLSKLLLLAKRMPFENGSGICVLTHTNVAIDEIKSKLGSKADILFKHPNFFGTIQSFVDKFLTIPRFKSIYKCKLKFIDSDYIFKQKANKYYNISFSKGEEKKTLRNYLYMQANIGRNNITSQEKDRNAAKLLCNLKYDLIDEKIKRKNGKTFLKDQNNEHYKKIKEIIFSFWASGILTYDDAYNFAEYALLYNSDVLKSIFSKRFHLLFVDEMQDTQKHQMNIFDQVFDETVIKQYYGDPDQAIFDGIDGGATAWDIPALTEKGFERLNISDSMRFGKEICMCLNPFKKIGCSVAGRSNSASIKPYIFSYNNPKTVLIKFCELIENEKLKETDEYKTWNKKSAPFNAVGFVGKDKDTLNIHHYFDEFSKGTTKRKINFNNLISYFQKRPISEFKEQGTSIYYKLFINALLSLLDQGSVKNDEKFYTSTSLKSILREEFHIEYEKFRLKIYDWIKDIGFNNSTPMEIKKDFIDFFKTELQKQCFNGFNDGAYRSNFICKTNLDV